MMTGLVPARRDWETIECIHAPPFLPGTVIEVRLEQTDRFAGLIEHFPCLDGVDVTLAMSGRGVNVRPNSFSAA